MDETEILYVFDKIISGKEHETEGIFEDENGTLYQVFDSATNFSKEIEENYYGFVIKDAGKLDIDKRKEVIYYKTKIVEDKILFVKLVDGETICNTVDINQIREELLFKEEDNSLVATETDLVVIPKTKIIENEEENKIVKNIKFIYENVTKTVIAQDEAVKRLIIEMTRISLHDKKAGIILTGSTGVGKTFLVETTAKYFNKAFLLIDSTQHTMLGYVGASIEDELERFYAEQGDNKERVENGVIFFDEIDKKGSDNKSDVSGSEFLNTLLKFLDGTTYLTKKAGLINTSKMTIIVGGAFSDIYKGFAMSNSEHPMGILPPSKKDNIRRKAGPTVDDFVKYGKMPEEFMCRFPITIHLNNLSAEDLEIILLNPNGGPIEIEKDIFRKLGVSFSVNKEYSTKVAQMAFKKKGGARGLSGTVSESSWRAFYEVASHLAKYDAVELIGETLEDNTKYNLIKKSTKIKI